MALTLATPIDLSHYLSYWGATSVDYTKGRPKGNSSPRQIAALTFVALHYPELYPIFSIYWKRNVNQALVYLQVNRRVYTEENPGAWRRDDVVKYLNALLDLWMTHYSPKEIFQMRYQNWKHVDLATLVDQLLTIAVEKGIRLDD